MSLNKMSEIVRDTILDIAGIYSVFPVLKKDGSDEFVKNLMLQLPNSRYFLYIRKEGIASNTAGMPNYFQVAIHPELFNCEHIEPNYGIEELINRRTKQNLFASSNYRGFPNFPGYNEPCAKCYKVKNFSALESLFINLTR